MRAVVITALITGLFCAGFAVVVDAVTDVLPFAGAIALAFVSGFLGSLLDQMVTGRGK